MERENQDRNAGTPPKELGPYAWPEEALATEKVSTSMILQQFCVHGGWIIVHKNSCRWVPFLLLGTRTVHAVCVRTNTA